MVERLVRTAQIATSKHPHQCKYGECAQALADDASLFLQRVNIIGDFDPLPDACPECHESKPSHKANCMAAICWRCKYPTPPSKAGSTNTAAITPQCHIPPICFPRGEQIGTDSQVLPRVRLPFTIPQGGSDDCLSMIQWPRERKQLRILLEQLQAIEDDVT